MPHFKMILRYENPPSEETVVFEAPDRHRASDACRSMLEGRDAAAAALAANNIYCSSRLSSCDLAPVDWRDELRCPGLLEDHV